MDTNYSDYGPREQYKMILLWISFEGRSEPFHTSASLAAEKDSSSNWPSDWLWIWSWYIGLVWHASGDTRHWPLPDIRIKSLWPTSGIRHSEDDSEEAGRRDAGQTQGQSGLQAHLPHLPPSLPERHILHVLKLLVLKWVQVLVQSGVGGTVLFVASHHINLHILCQSNCLQFLIELIFEGW